MIIGKYIRQLLEDRKRIILPGFGNLEVKETEGGIPASGTSIDPPGLGVRFDAGYSKDDGLLASALSGGEMIDEEEAAQRVLELVDAIKYALDKGEPYKLSDAGTFTRDDNGKVHFKSDPNWVLVPEQYGLEPLELLELSEEEEEVPLITTAHQDPNDKVVDTKPETFQLEKPIQTNPFPQPKSRAMVKQDRYFNKWKVVWIVAGGLIVILIGLILIPGNKDQDFEQNIPKAIEKPQGPSEDPLVAEPQKEDEPAAAESESEKLSDPEEAQPVVQEPKYFIIAGSFKHLKNASDLQDQLKARGYPAEVMITENRMYRVSVATFATEQEAETALADLKTVSGLESCWLLSN